MVLGKDRYIDIYPRKKTYTYMAYWSLAKAPRKLNLENMVFSTNGLGITSINLENNGFDLYTTLCNNSKWWQT